MEYIQIKPKKYNKIKIKGETMKFFIKVNTEKSKAKDTYKKAKAEHNLEIKKLKREIKLHRQLKKQAKSVLTQQLRAFKIKNLSK